MPNRQSGHSKHARNAWDQDRMVAAAGTALRMGQLGALVLIALPLLLMLTLVSRRCSDPKPQVVADGGSGLGLSGRRACR